MLLALALTLVQVCLAQLNRKKSPPKGPRALALLQLMPNGQAHLIPIVILIGGKYYDAGSYKASPVPMALESGTVYEAFRTGNSEGLFTVTQVRQLKDSFIADGKWHAGPPEPAVKEKASAPSKPDLDEDSGPPKLRRSPPPTAPAETTAPPAATAPPASAPAAAPAQTSADAKPEPQPEPESAPEDPNRPVLHRGKHETAKQEIAKSSKPGSKPQPTSADKTPAKAAPPANPASPQLIPAISDEHSPEAQPYTYDLKPDEEQKFRTRMLALAAEQVLARDKQLTSGTGAPAAPARSASKARSPKPPQPDFEDVQLRVFDLSNSNEPTLVLTASAHMPQTVNGSSDRQYFVTLVARNNIYNELRKAFVNLTDPQHLDVTSRLDLIDAVDVDGDGRGELLFRETSDDGQGYIIYRVIGEQLYPLYNSRAGE